MRALGGDGGAHLGSGSSAAHARRYLGPLAGFITGWTYTLEMVIVALADVTAFGIYMGLQVPRCAALDLDPQHHLLFIGAMNLCNVRVFGRDGVLAVSGEGGGDYRH